MRRRTQKNSKGKNFSTFNKTQQLAKSWDPLPERKHIGKGGKGNKKTIESRSNFINCKERMFNKGKYKGIQVRNVPAYYLTWVYENIKLNQTELTLLKRELKLERKKKELQTDSLETKINKALSKKNITEWEYKFLKSLRSFENLSQKQTIILNKILLK